MCNLQRILFAWQESLQTQAVARPGVQAPAPHNAAGDAWTSAPEGVVDAPVGLEVARATAKAEAVTLAQLCTTVHYSVSKPSPTEEVIELLSGDEGDTVDNGCLAKAGEGARADGVPRVRRDKADDTVCGELVILDDETVDACLPTSTAEEGLQTFGATSRPNCLPSKDVSRAETLTGTPYTSVNLAETDGKSAAVTKEDEEARSPPTSKELAAYATVARTGGAEVLSVDTSNTVQGSVVAAANKPGAAIPPTETSSTEGCSVPR